VGLSEGTLLRGKKNSCSMGTNKKQICPTVHALVRRAHARTRKHTQAYKTPKQLRWRKMCFLTLYCTHVTVSSCNWCIYATRKSHTTYKLVTGESTVASARRLLRVYLYTKIMYARILQRVSTAMCNYILRLLLGTVMAQHGNEHLFYPRSTWEWMEDLRSSQQWSQRVLSSGM
jgi:hypothetical protein